MHHLPLDGWIGRNVTLERMRRREKEGGRGGEGALGVSQFSKVIFSA
jgi:hypothetical protein